MLASKNNAVKKVNRTLYNGGIISSDMERCDIIEPMNMARNNIIPCSSRISFQIALIFFIIQPYFCGSIITFIESFAFATSLNPLPVSFNGSLWVIISFTSIFFFFKRSIASVISSPAPAYVE